MYGIDLRYDFGYEYGYSYDCIDDCFKDKPCSVLEMMIALAVTCDGLIKHDMEDHTGYWFWKMIENLGLISMKNSKFDRKASDIVISRFLNKQYDKNGKGGLFVINDSNHDMRIIDIWYQMLWYLDEIIS